MGRRAVSIGFAAMQGPGLESRSAAEGGA